LKKSEIKKTIRKIKEPKKNISDLIGKPVKPVNWVTQINMSNPQTR
jgi:hypothetical protein